MAFRNYYGATVDLPITLSDVAAISMIALGALVLADWQMALKTVASIAALTGFLNGVHNGVELANANSSALVATGIACAIFAMVSICAGQVDVGAYSVGAHSGESSRQLDCC